MQTRLPKAVAGLAASAVAALLTATAPEGPAAAEMPEVHALTGVRIVVAPGREIASGTVVLREGVIEAVGAEVEPPADAEVWEHAGLSVYPGLIEPYAVHSWPDGAGSENGAESSGRDAREEEHGGHDNALVTPERDMALHAYDAKRFERLRAAGFTSAVLAPEEGLFRGTSALFNLGEGGLRSNLLRRGVAQNITFATRRRSFGYPTSLMGSVALARQTLLDARWYAAAHAAYATDPRQKRPPTNTALAALGPLAAGEAPAVIETGDVLGTLRAASLVEEFELQAILVGNGEEYKRLDAVAATGLVHLLPLAFPEPPDVGTEGDARDVTLEELRHWDLAPANPARLAEKGVRFAFTSHQLGEPRELHGKLAAAIERGLPAADALAGLTTVPAELLGLGERLGTVEKGKIANLVVVEGDLFVDKPKLREVWIDGRRYELREIKAPEVDPAGTWELEVSAGDFEFQMTAEITGSVGALSGQLQTPFGVRPFDSVEVSGTTVILESSTPQGAFILELEIDGERARGTGTSPRGTVRIRGKRTAGPGAAAVEEVRR